MPNRISLLVALEGANEGLKRAISSAERSFNEMSATAKTAGAKAAQGMAELKAGTAALGDQLTRARTQLLAFVGVSWATQQVTQLVQVADQWNLMVARLKLATAGQREFAIAQSELFAIAQRIGVPLAEVSTLYGKLQQAVRQLGGEQKTALSLTESISQAAAPANIQRLAAPTTLRSALNLRVSRHHSQALPMTPGAAHDDPRWCPFCNPDPQRVFLRLRHVFALWDGFPVTDGHALIVPYRHVPTWFDASNTERAELFSAIDTVCSIIRERGGIDGFNFGVNVGAAAGQTVPHLHQHVIPRRTGDMPDPRGVRHVIPGKGNYLLTREAPRGPSIADAGPGHSRVG